ncbi:hypothetical protein BBK82_23165 [Lentzea guizhouensis]|uniref:AB hydrolase-1 domain-containing protein n=1 Tax=Lentzea guizhouensis TaxID=1586287 RepID=A0A1B2HLC5_9PSEU|nr:alpha/beta hydrolase [Lentzea guizhouensis]ANZ38527.1 hypothetical protein BBK82_23165 [Lentzea guizhouensis]
MNTGRSTITTTSADGTAIVHRTTGTGEALVVVPGPLEQAEGLDDLAAGLADGFAVHVLERRGRGGSGPCRPGHGLHTEVEDVRAVLAATGARKLVGLSSGAVIALQTALRVPGITHVVAWEPPVGVTTRKAEVFARVDRELRKNQHAEAVVTLLKGLEAGPHLLRAVPRGVLVALLRKWDEEEDPRDMRELLPTLRDDLRVVAEGSENLWRFTALRSEVLLARGAKSPRYLADGVTALAKTLPRARQAVAPDAHHLNPERALPVFRDFLKS